MLFVIYISNLDMNVGGVISMFADNKKMCGILDSEEECLRLQQDYNR